MYIYIYIYIPHIILFGSYLIKSRRHTRTRTAPLSLFSAYSFVNTFIHIQKRFHIQSFVFVLDQLG